MDHLPLGHRCHHDAPKKYLLYKTKPRWHWTVSPLHTEPTLLGHVELTIAIDRPVLTTLEVSVLTETLRVWCYVTFRYVLRCILQGKVMLVGSMASAIPVAVLSLHVVKQGKGIVEVGTSFSCPDCTWVFLMHWLVQVMLFCILWCMLPYSST